MVGKIKTVRKKKMKHYSCGLTNTLSSKDEKEKDKKDLNKPKSL